MQDSCFPDLCIAHRSSDVCAYGNPTYRLQHNVIRAQGGLVRTITWLEHVVYSTVQAMVYTTIYYVTIQAMVWTPVRK